MCTAPGLTFPPTGSARGPCSPLSTVYYSQRGGNLPPPRARMRPGWRSKWRKGSLPSEGLSRVSRSPELLLLREASQIRTSPASAQLGTEACLHHLPHPASCCLHGRVQHTATDLGSDRFCPHTLQLPEQLRQQKRQERREKERTNVSGAEVGELHSHRGSTSRAFSPTQPSV